MLWSFVDNITYKGLISKGLIYTANQQRESKSPIKRSNGYAYIHSTSKWGTQHPSLLEKRKIKGICKISFSGKMEVLKSVISVLNNYTLISLF